MTDVTQIDVDIDTVKTNLENPNEFELNSIATKNEEDPEKINNMSDSIEEKKSDSDFEDLIKLGIENDLSNTVDFLKSSQNLLKAGNSSKKMPIKPKFKIKTPTELYPKSKREKTNNFTLPQSRNTKKLKEIKGKDALKDLKQKDFKDDCKSKNIKHGKQIGQGTILQTQSNQSDKLEPLNKIAATRCDTRKKMLPIPKKKPLNKKDISKTNETSKRVKTTNPSPTMPVLSPQYPVQNKLLSATKSRRFSCPDFKAIKNQIKKRSRKMSGSSLRDDIERIETRREALLIESALMEAVHSFSIVTNGIKPCSIVLEQCDVKKELKKLKDQKIEMLEKHCKTAAHQLAVLFQKKRGRPRKYSVGVKTTEQNQNIVLKIKRVAADNVKKRVGKLLQKPSNKPTLLDKEIVEVKYIKMLLCI